MMDLTGQVFTRLTVLKESIKKGVRRHWLCRCSCGVIKEVPQAVLVNGQSKSCGCLKKELAAAAKRTHGKWHTKLYKVHNSMKQRCLNTNSPAYEHYGGKGISVCVDWTSFELFEKWALSAGYKEGLTIDRINGDKDYCPENCRWVVHQIQTRNRSKSKTRSSSDYLGVSTAPNRNKKYRARCIGKTIGYFYTAIEAAKARDQYIIDNKLTDFNLNFA